MSSQRKRIFIWTKKLVRNKLKQSKSKNIFSWITEEPGEWNKLPKKSSTKFTLGKLVCDLNTLFWYNGRRKRKWWKIDGPVHFWKYPFWWTRNHQKFYNFLRNYLLQNSSALYSNIFTFTGKKWGVQKVFKKNLIVSISSLIQYVKPFSSPECHTVILREEDGEEKGEEQNSLIFWRDYNDTKTHINLY